MRISIRGLNKADVLAALYNAARTQAKGFLAYDATPMTADEAKAILEKSTNFDYLKGRVMKLDLKGDDFFPDLYDRDNGEGTAQKVIDTLKASGDVNNPVIANVHSTHVQVAAMETRAQLGEKTTLRKDGVTLGLADVADRLGPAVDRVLRKD